MKSSRNHVKINCFTPLQEVLIQKGYGGTQEFFLLRWFCGILEFENFCFNTHKSSLVIWPLNSDLSSVQRGITTPRSSSEHSVKLRGCSLAGWHWQAWTTKISQASSQGLPSLPCQDQNPGHHFEMKFSQKSSSPVLWPNTQTLLHPYLRKLYLNILCGECRLKSGEFLEGWS